MSDFYELMTKRSLWKEIEIIVGCLSISESDKELLLELIKTWSKKK